MRDALAQIEEKLLAHRRGSDANTVGRPASLLNSPNMPANGSLTESPFLGSGLPPIQEPSNGQARAWELPEAMRPASPADAKGKARLPGMSSLYGAGQVYVGEVVTSEKRSRLMF